MTNTKQMAQIKNPYYVHLIKECCCYISYSRTLLVNERESTN